MITLDRDRCTKCGTCISIGHGYCISDQDGYPVFNSTVCNVCQKCVAVCPSQAIMVNSMYPERISERSSISPEELVAFFETRRSTKLFQDRPIAEGELEMIVAAAKYAPNQNKNIDIHVVTDRSLIRLIDDAALRFVRIFHRLLFGFRPLTWFIRLFSKHLDVIEKKMVRDLVYRKGVVKKNTQAVIFLTGDKKVPVTEHSAAYLMAAMLYMAEALEVGTCLMDSLLLTLRTNRRLRTRLEIREDVLAVMVLGYSAERVVNIPRGYEIKTFWNVGAARSSNGQESSRSS